MGLYEYVATWIGYANVFIATFIMIYAYLFLHQTVRHRDRKPWDFLFIASVLYLIYQIFNVLYLSGVHTLNVIDLNLVSNTMSFLYSGCVLLAFISQHDLILKSHLILISKKDDKILAESNIEIDTKKVKKE